MNDFYEHIELTPEEIKLALHEARKRKYFHEKNKLYWEGQEVKKQRVIVSKLKQIMNEI